ncbi:ribonucleotide-diphosphate reductase subunit beta [Thermogemmatispora carboxidivorans]|uniref:ribonucleotide-diphosphate reductase subunit beta n=1 Tax=Thermogemmatispora carboxidivorans TaxID=1382306 RepID=UPI000699BFBA|nr:ribonucleotide-diphosphate reductase subunit beta [Thermogemmatispora carboxidivorans]
MTTEPAQQEGFIDVDSEQTPPVEKDRLYRLWEEGNWSAKALDFSQDALDWREKHSERERAAILWNCSMFLDGEESVTLTLAPFVEPAPRPEDKIFLATQIADEARHHVFFDRFIREVCQLGQDISTTLSAVRPHLSWGFVQVFTELDRAAERLRRNPHSLPLLAQGVVLYHIVIEGMLAHTGQHFLREYTTRTGLLPALGRGIFFVSRDESRHIAFGIQLLRELVSKDRRCKEATIEMLNRILAWTAGVLAPPDHDWSYITCLGFTPQEMFAFGLRSLYTKLRRAGIDPHEVSELAKLGLDDPFEVQAERIIKFIEGGVLGTGDAPHVTEETMETIFTSMRLVAAWSQQRSKPLRASIQWLFDDMQPRYLKLEPGEPPVAGVGRLENPRLTLRCSANDWARLSSRRLNQRQAVLSRRLRISGDWRLALELPRLLAV